MLSKYSLCKMVIAQKAVPKESIIFGMNIYLSKGEMTQEQYDELFTLLNSVVENIQEQL